MFKKLLLGLAVLVTMQILAEASDCSSHDMILGRRSWNDKVIYEKTIKLDSKWLQKQSLDVSFPPKGASNPHKITRIELTDRMKAGEGGCAYLTRGGVGEYAVELHLKTQRGNGMKFDLKVYGEP
uniref:Venom protein family 3 protein 1 n=1 Tax=Lethocerus distinctifemur TaxID=280095 RepID=A0A2K8JR81_9HEMI|nr:venom protein family 3 protein 1 [Lethocerus distinctifemur]